MLRITKASYNSTQCLLPGASTQRRFAHDHCRLPCVSLVQRRDRQHSISALPRFLIREYRVNLWLIFFVRSLKMTTSTQTSQLTKGTSQ